jgi:hypothetical protein
MRLQQMNYCLNIDLKFYENDSLRRFAYNAPICPLVYASSVLQVTDMLKIFMYLCGCE